MRVTLVIISFALLLSACSSKRAPKGILEPEPMQEVLFDMLMAGEFLNGYVLLRDTGIHKLVKSDQVYNKVLALHKIDRATFEKSITWYQQHPQMMKEVLDSIAANKVEKTDVLPNMPAPVIGQDFKPDTLLNKSKLREPLPEPLPMAPAQ